MGTHRDNGARLEGLADIEQSVEEILRTPLRTRPCRPTFGTDLLSIVDAPLNAEGRAILAARTVDAIAQWERRIEVERTRFDVNADGEVIIDLDGRTALGAVRASSGRESSSDYARLLRPSGYYDVSTYEAGIWKPRVGARALGPVIHPFAQDPEDARAQPPTLAADGIWSANNPLWFGDGEIPIAPDRRWTVGVAYPAASDFSGSAATHLELASHADEESAFDTVAIIFNDALPPASTVPPFMYVAHTDANYVIAPPEGGHVVSWLWFHPGAGSRAPRIGTETAAGSLEIEIAPIDGHLALSVGGGVAVGGAARSTTHVGIWPRVLTRRERLGMAALWRRERANPR